jgi:hypothetical protein
MHKLYIRFCILCCMFLWHISFFMFSLFLFIISLLGIIFNVFSADWFWRGGLILAICGQNVWQTHLIESKKWTYRVDVLCWCGLYYCWLTNTAGRCCPDKQTDSLVTSEKWRQNLFCHETLHVSGIFCAHHQKLWAVHLAIGAFHAGYVATS